MNHKCLICDAVYPTPRGCSVHVSTEHPEHKPVTDFIAETEEPVSPEIMDRYQKNLAYREAARLAEAEKKPRKPYTRKVVTPKMEADGAGMAYVDIPVNGTVRVYLSALLNIK